MIEIMKLSDLEPQFYRYEQRMDEIDFCVGDPATWRERGCPSEKRTELRDFRVPVETLSEAQCVWFTCPKCSQEKGGLPGCHSVEVTFAGRGVLPGQGIKNSQGVDVRWDVSGTGYHDLTTKPSILIIGGCEWHGFITNGEVS